MAFPSLKKPPQIVEMAANGNLIFQDTNKATFVGANSNVVIDTVNASFGVGVDVNGPTSNLHVVGNAYVTSNLEVGTANLFVDTVNSRVGIGVVSPDKRLHVYTGAGEGNTQLHLQSADRYSTIQMLDDTGAILFGNDRGAMRFITGYDASLSGGSEAMRILGNGNVGVGTTNPQYRLDVGNGGGDVMLRVMNQTASSGKLIFGRSGDTEIRSHAIESYNSSGSQNNYMKFLVHDGTGTSPYETRTEVMTLLGNGNVGVGTTNPVAKLHVHDDTDTTGTGDAFISGLTGNTSNRKPTECLRLQSKWYSSGSGALLRFTNQHPQGTFPNTGEYNLAGIAGYDHNSSWGGGLAFYTSPGTGSGGDDLTLRMSIDSIGAVNIPGPTTGATHGSASMLYLLDTPLIKEWQWTGSTNNTLRVTFSASELPINCKAIYADVFMPQASLDDHVGHALGKNHGQQTMWTGARNARPSTAFGNLALQQCFLSMPGQSDAFEYFYGNWWNSCIIPLDTQNRLYHTVSGESSGTQSWMYIVVKGYFH